MSLLDAILLEPLKRTNEVWIAWRTDGNKGTGTEDDPYNGSTQALFDTLMRSLDAQGLGNITIHIGPGVFETHGTGGLEVGVGWRMRQGWKIQGSGIDVTVIKLVGVDDESRLILAIGNKLHDDRADHSEVSDLTVDCNLPGNPGMSVGAVSLVGSHTRIRRVRAIHFGTETSEAECFVLVIASAHPALDQVAELQDCMIEDCICEHPSENNARETTVLLVSSGETRPDGIMAHPRATVLRNNYINCIYSQNEVPIASLGYSATTATVTTKVAHGRNTGAWVAISGAHVNGTLDVTYFNGTFQITRLNDTQFTYAMEATPPAVPTGAMFVDRYSSHVVSVDTLENNGTTATLTTKTPHFRKPGQMVTVSSTDVLTPVNPGDPDSRPWYGSFEVKEVNNNRELEYEMASEPPNQDEGFKFVGVAFHGMSNGGISSIIEGNRAVHCRIGIYHDTWSKKFLIARNNHLLEVNTGYFENMGGTSTFDNNDNLRPGQSLVSSYVNGEHIATFTTQKPHGLVVDQAVRIIADSGHEAYAGFYAVDTVPSDTTFTYKLTSAPSSSSASNPKFGALWQVGHVEFENNVIDLIPIISNFGPPRGIEFADRGVSTFPEYIFRNVIIRDNLIRHFDELAINRLAIRLASCEHALVEGNTIFPELLRPMDYFRSKRVAYFNNRTFEGTLLQGISSDSEVTSDDLTTKLVDSLMLAL